MINPLKNKAIATTGLLALAHTAKAQSMNFVNQDGVDRTVVFTANAGLQPIGNLHVPGGRNAVQGFPAGWIGNAYAVPNGGNLGLPGVLAEVNFAGWNGVVFFDVSTIVNTQPDIDSGVKEMFPSQAGQPLSGCQTYTTTCPNAYNQPNDLQTKGTSESDFTVLLGNQGAAAPSAPQAPASSAAPQAPASSAAPAAPASTGGTVMESPAGVPSFRWGHHHPRRAVVVPRNYTNLPHDFVSGHSQANSTRAAVTGAASSNRGAVRNAVAAASFVASVLGLALLA